MTDWRIVHDSRETRPPVLETGASESTVYERRNIQQTTEDDPMTGEPFTQWTYEQREYTREEYAEMTSPAIQGVQQSISALELMIAEI